MVLRQFQRSLTVTPGMCGRNTLFIGTVGDWTWDFVRRDCRVNPYAAFDAPVSRRTLVLLHPSALAAACRSIA